MAERPGLINAATVMTMIINNRS